MQLTREAIQRMVGTGGMVMGGGGGEGGGISADFLSQNYVAIPYFSQLFTIHGKQTTTVDGTVTDEQDITLPPNTMPSRTETTDGGVTTVVETTITRIEALFDFNSVGGVSALGYNPGGGGGGDTLTEPLDSINNAGLGMPTAAGQVITWNGTQWIFDIPEGGGGGGTGTVTSITAGTGLSGGTITTMGTIAISSTYQGYITHGETAYGWGNHANAGYLTQSSLSGYATQSWVANQGYATQTWVTGRGYITSAALSGYATQAWVNNQGYATQTWVNNQGYVTLDTQQEITATKTFSVYQDMKGINLDPTGDIRETTTNYGTFYLGYNAGGGNGFNLYNSLGGYLISGLSNGNVGIGNRAPAYNLDVTGNIHTTSAYYLDGKLLANNNSGLHFGYGFASADLPTTIWGNGISFRSSDGNYGSCTNIGNTYGIMGTDFIGVTNKFRFEYDSGSNTVWVMKTDGSAVNFASLGGVSALGISTGGSPSVSELTVGTLKGVRYLQNASGAVSITSGNSYIYIGAGSGSNVYIADSSNTYFDTSGHLHLTGKRLYLDSTRYVYVSNSHLYFYNGSSSVQIA